MSSQYDWTGDAEVSALRGRVAMTVTPRSQYRDACTVDITLEQARELAAELLAAADESERLTSTAPTRAT